MARCVVDVINQMREVIPEAESDLRTKIITYKESLWNISPEMLSSGEYFLRVQRILVLYIKEIDEPWKEKLQKIFNDEK